MHAPGDVREGDSFTTEGSTCVITDRSGAEVVERCVHLPAVAALHRQCAVAAVLALCAVAVAVAVVVVQRR